jgi:hypothetical protein
MLIIVPVHNSAHVDLKDTDWRNMFVLILDKVLHILSHIHCFFSMALK